VLALKPTVGSRGTTIGIVLGWQIVAAPVCPQITTLGLVKGCSGPQLIALHPPLSSKAARKCRYRLPQQRS
jgi:hypothetical protein